MPAGGRDIERHRDDDDYIVARRMDEDLEVGHDLYDKLVFL